MSGADGYGDIGAGDTAQSAPASQPDPDSPQPSNPALDGYHTTFSKPIKTLKSLPN